MDINVNRPIVLYMHAGSGNHGCEAIANTTVKMIAEKRRQEGISTKLPVFIVTNSAEEDRKYSLGKLEKKGLCTIVEENHIDRHFFDHLIYYIYRKLSGDEESFLRYRFKDAGIAFNEALERCEGEWDNTHRPLAISIGGDNYCYPEMLSDLILAHNVFIDRGFKTVLWGCSIEPDSLKDKNLLDDMKAFDLIYARESITYNALKDAGIEEEILFLEEDPAFKLDTKEPKEKEGFVPGKTIGINLSPMVQDRESTPGITMKNYTNFIDHVLKETDLNIALIPHVVWPTNDDRKPLSELFSLYKDTGRVVMIDDCSAEELKGYISKCCFFIGARTHSTIAAYSSKVPTLVIGYSVKSRGIATDLFGTYENYVLPVQELKEEDSLIKAYEFLKERLA
ncbi:polysaccharide pyruvyl transferase family protein [Butyrivibrio sp. INlla21]|uniref:polysaccharide pyruvyl transferase family protein n=1 Tax=Butyrivibrio sp. INlla21 TaxID=1520811 RepID=UPI0008EA13D0|nr:polysaccharide pyruvyl transferase family protein [Butyrivibrio sp. INlla21]SFU66750.1 Polysaccharide pyruvyl transferase family protein WcaK [Butyrivibrio sp. INlla21]